MKYLITTLTFLAHVLVSGQDTTFFTSMKFDFNSSEVLTSELVKLDELVKELELEPLSYSIHLGGHTDFIGSDEFNNTLSEARVGSVLAVLRDRYPELNGASYTWSGEQLPLDAAETDQARALNRRVDITLDMWFPEEEVVYVPQDTTLYGARGTIIDIPECAFDVPMDKITFEVEEVLDTDDMLRTGTTTVDADGNCLSSGGMVFIRAYHNGQPIEMTGDCDVVIKIPTSDPDPAMNLYQSDIAAVSNSIDYEMSHAKWETDNEPIDVTTNPGYYTFPVRSTGGFNCDKLVPSISLPTFKNPFKHDGLVVKTKGLKGADVFLAFNEVNAAVEGDMYKRNEKKHVFERGCSDQTELAELLVAYDGDDLFDDQLIEVKYSNFRNLWIVKKKDWD